MKKRPLIIDCDPGVDDAQAIMMLNASGKFEIMGVTAVGGNVALDKTAPNALNLCALFGMECPVARGAEKALLRKRAGAQHAHGDNGLAGFELAPSKRRFYPRWAWELIYETAVQCEGELELIALGPLTDIAITLLKYPRLTEYIKTLYIMGGAAHAGNATPFAEFNFWYDPEAAAIVLEADFKRIVQVDLDACYTAYMTDDEVSRVNNIDSEVGKLLQKSLEFRHTMYDSPEFSERKELFRNKYVSCDAAAAAVAIDESIAKKEPYYILCECQSSICDGQSIVDWGGRFARKPNAELVRSVNRERFVQMFLESAEYYTGRGGADEPRISYF